MKKTKYYGSDHNGGAPEERARGITLKSTGHLEVISTHGGVSLTKRTFTVKKEDIAHLLLDAKDLSSKNKEEQGDNTTT